MKTNQVTTAGYAGEESNHLYKVALTGLFAALSYVVFTFCRSRSPFPAEMPPPFIWEMRSVCWVP